MPRIAAVITHKGSEIFHNSPLENIHINRDTALAYCSAVSHFARKNFRICSVQIVQLIMFSTASTKS